MYKTVAKVIIYTDKPVKATGLVSPALDKELFLLEVIEHEPSEDMEARKTVFTKAE